MAPAREDVAGHVDREIEGLTRFGRTLRGSNQRSCVQVSPEVGAIRKAS